jgi:hypothetical protein
MLIRFGEYSLRLLPHFLGKEVKRCPAWGVSESARTVLMEGTGMSSPHFFTNIYITIQIYNTCLHLKADNQKQSGRKECKPKSEKGR